MIRYPEYHLRGEIRRILRREPSPEILLRIRGQSYDPDRPETFLHVRARDRSGRGRALGVGREVTLLLLATVDFLEEREKPARSLDVDGRPGAERIPGAIRVVGHDTRIAGEVVRRLDDETFVLDAGIPLVVRIPAPTGLPEVGEHVEFLLKEPIRAELF